MTYDVDVAVVGGGLVGTAAAWALSRRGAEVALLEARAIGHDEGSSHGSSRIFRRGYPFADYVGLTGRAQDLWEELGEESGEQLLRRTGGIDHGADRQVDLIEAAFRAEGVPCQLLSSADAEARWPGMRFTTDVLHHPEAGVIDADATVRALARCAAARGAEVREGAEVERVEADGDGDGGIVHLADGPLRARRVVIAAGAWLGEVLPDAVTARLPGVTVTQQQVFHFRRREPDVAWPTFIHKEGDEVYGLPSGTDGGADPAFKVAEHERGTPTSPRARDRRVDPGSRRRMTSFVEERLPGLVPEVVAETTCLYTVTDDRDFVMDRHGGLVVASPCSGHGAKFTPVLGEIIADLALTDAAATPRFALRPARSAG